MSDYNGSKPVQTIRDNEFKTKIVDGQSGETATDVMSVVQHTDALSAGTNDFGVPVIAHKTSDDSLIILPVPLPIDDNGTSITVDAEDFDIRNLDHSTDNVSVQDTDGHELNMNADGSINVVTSNAAGTLKSEYATEAAGAVNTEVIKFFPITNLKTAWGKSILIGARGAVKVRFGLSSNGTTITTVKGVYFQDPKENYDHNIEFLSLLGDGTAAIAVGVTNLDAASSDLYWNVQFREV